MNEERARRTLETEDRRLAALQARRVAAIRADRGSEADGNRAGEEWMAPGTDLFEREVDLSLLHEIEGERAAVHLALQRLDAGTYGRCRACDRQIPDARLEALPATPFCVEHELEAEVHLQATKSIAGTDHAEAAAIARIEAQHNLDLLEDEEADQEHDGFADLPAEDQAIHVEARQP